nr:putative reverse transcriptase domain-containing protein [Tanacetum cinerariifolium]
MMVSTLWIKLYSEYEYEIRYHPGKENVVTDALTRKERVKPRRVRAMAMTIQYGVRGMKLAAQSEVFKQENVLAERLHGLDQQLERKEEESLYFMDHIWFHCEMDDLPRGLADATESVRDAIGFEYYLASSSRKTK